MVDLFYIAYEFPPLNVGGVFRPLKFVKYFNDFNIKPIIFTLKTEDYQKVYLNKKLDENLLSDINNVEKDIIQVKSDSFINKPEKKIIHFFNILEKNHKIWKTYFFKEAKAALLKYSPKVILVTAPPFGVIELAVKLSKNTEIPLIIDMRDSFSMWVSHPYRSYFHYKYTLYKERKWFNHAEKIITVTQQLVDEWTSLHKKIPVNKFKVISNGFDENIKFNTIKLDPIKDRLTIGYIGSFYYHPESRDLMFKPWYKKKSFRKLQYSPRKEDWLYRSPYFVFKTLAHLFKRYPALRDKINLKFIGNKPLWFNDMVTEFGVSKNVAHLGFLTYNDSVVFQKRNRVA